MLRHVSPYLQNISPTAEQHTFRFVFFGEDLVFNLSLHMLWAPRSTLWVVGCGSLVMPICPTCLWAPCSTLWTMGQSRPRVQHRIHCLGSAYATFISKFVQQLPSSTLSALFFYREDPVTDLSLHMPRASRSMLRVVGCGSLVTPVPPTCVRAPCSTF